MYGIPKYAVSSAGAFVPPFASYFNLYDVFVPLKIVFVFPIASFKTTYTIAFFAPDDAVNIFVYPSV